MRQNNTNVTKRHNSINFPQFYITKKMRRLSAKIHVFDIFHSILGHIILFLFGHFEVRKGSSETKRFPFGFLALREL